MHYIIPMKTTTLQIRLNQQEKEAFERAAELSGISLSAWVRERLRSTSIRELENAGIKVPFVNRLQLNG
jgi:hypothetical protein